jgi:hypothetical protein
VSVPQDPPELVTGDPLTFDDGDSALAQFEANGWGDGLPLVAPTRPRVEAMLAGCPLPPDTLLGSMPTRWRPTYVHHVAVNAVMAGCTPAYFRVVVAAIQGVLRKEFNLYGVQGTTNPCGVMVIVNGPVRTDLGVNCGGNLFGQGWKANATIGRAVRLCLLNIGGGIPGIGDMSTLGNPNKYGSCIGENEEASPWSPLHVDRGFRMEVSTVTVASAVAPQNVITMSEDGMAVIDRVAHALISSGSNIQYLEQEPVVVFSPTQAARIAETGITKDTLRYELWMRGRTTLDGLSVTENKVIRDWRRPSIAIDNGREYLHPTPSPDAIAVVVAGGEGPHSAVIATFNGSRLVTTEIPL